MALEALHDRDSISFSLVAKMKASRQTPGPNGSRVAKKRSLPQLGYGLSAILTTPTDSSTPSTDSSFHASSRESSLGSTVSTPVSSGDSPDIIQHCGANEGTDAFYFHTSSCGLFTPSVQHQSPSPTLAEGLSQLSITKDNDIQAARSHHDRLPLFTPTADLPMHLSSSPTPKVNTTAEIWLELSTSNHPAGPSTLNEIVTWLFDGRVSLSQAKEMAEKYQYEDLLEALEAPQATMIEEIIHVVTSRQQKSEMSTVIVQPPNPATYISNHSHPATHSQQPSPNDAIVGRFHSKLIAYSNAGSVIMPETETNVHVFVDMSNIYIGFCDTVKAVRRIPRNCRITAPTFSFRVFSTVLERGRGVQKRVLAGSTHTCSAKDPRMYWPDYFLEAEKLGYKMNIFSRVQTRKQKRRGYTPPGNSSYEARCLSPEDSSGDDGTGVAYEVRNGEQGVDENLHLNMMNSMLDHLNYPGTMVLATGDAAEAEFSGGFLKYATRALDNGWKLELVTWKRAISSAWTNSDFLEKYKGRFRIIFLDDFFEELQINYVSF
ncbi:hypothetical protein F5Y06DRAFT_94585 [Hypoxylon sp. FL0890]|nr:hypothetical protein F5Y06DRAFT_94585 [Hypoxylon sp. FL0890]